MPSGAAAEVAIAVGGNAVILADREGFEQSLPVPALDGAVADGRRCSKARGCAPSARSPGR